jgi:hypothetical protein
MLAWLSHACRPISIPQLLREEPQHADSTLRFLHLHVCATLNIALKPSRFDDRYLHHFCIADLF